MLSDGDGAAEGQPCHAERSEASRRPSRQILRFAQDDKQGPSPSTTCNLCSFAQPPSRLWNPGPVSSVDAYWAQFIALLHHLAQRTQSGLLDPCVPACCIPQTLQTIAFGGSGLPQFVQTAPWPELLDGPFEGVSWPKYGV